MKTFKHSGKMGDVIWALPFIKSMGGAEILYLNISKKNNFTIESIEFLKPLLEYQSCIKEIKIWNNEKVDYDLDTFHDVLKTGPCLAPVSYFKSFFVYDAPKSVLIKPWLECPVEEQTNSIILSHRIYDYSDWEKMFVPHNFYIEMLDKGLENIALFVGTETEHEKFNETYNCNIKHKKVNDALELACLIKNSQLSIGNQSLPTVIAESLKKTLHLEVHGSTFEHRFNRPNLFLLNEPRWNEKRQ
jgi:hypothetical protein